MSEDAGWLIDEELRERSGAECCGVTIYIGEEDSIGSRISSRNQRLRMGIASRRPTQRGQSGGVAR